MSGICGWMDRGVADSDSAAVLAAMQSKLSDGEAAGPHGFLHGGFGLAAQPGIRPASIHRTDGFLAAIEGHSRWRQPHLDRIAAEQGAAVALAMAYREHGADCLRELLGPFAVAVIDTRAAAGMVAIDRMGTRTMCFSHVAGRLVFGSNADSVIAQASVDRELSRQAIFNYLYCHVVPSPGTIYRSVRKLMPGECITYRDGRVDTRFYWHLPYRDDANESVEALERRLHELLRDATRNAIDDTSAIGAFLSGGTDSSTVTALLTELRHEPVRTYSIGFPATGFDEMNYARISARRYGARAREYYATPEDIVDAIPVIARAYDEPFGNDSAAPTYVCARIARDDGVRVMLAGDGGDEIFGGNVRYAKQKVFEAWGHIPGPLRRALIQPVAFAPGSARVPPLRKLASYIRQASIPLPDRLESYNFLHRSPLSEVFEPEFLASVSTEEPLELLRDVYDRTTSASPVNRMMHLDLKITLADNDLRKVTRMCDVAGIEVRYPLLDDDLVDFTGEIPAALKVKGLKLRYFFKHAMRNILPPETIAKQKHGFGMPFGLWLRDHRPMADLVFGSLDAFGRRGILRRGYLEELRHQHLTGHATYFGIMIWVIAMLECWLDARDL